jgi:3-dehydroquinate synthase
MPLAADAPPFLLDPGENSKTVTRAAEAWDWLAGEGMRRDDLLVAVGGGVVGDLAGFVASTYIRGLAFWQVPTSLLAQVDSSVGGKVALNLRAGKNLVGSFYQPDLAVIDPEVLATLPHEELENGLGEVVKYGLLVGEPLLGTLERAADRLRAGDPDELDRVVERCVRYKAAVVEMDERESGLRSVLNLGHSVGHALEALAGYGPLAHGRAVGLGMLAALALSERLLGLEPGVRARVETLLARLGLPTKTAVPNEEAMRRALARDKKATAGGPGFIGLHAPGEPVTGLDASWEQVREALKVIDEQ